MLFYCFELNKESKDMCIINNTFDLYSYVQLPMGIKVSLDIMQSIIYKILEGTGSEGYIDDCEYWSNDNFDCHLMAVPKIFMNLEKRQYEV